MVSHRFPSSSLPPSVHNLNRHTASFNQAIAGVPSSAVISQSTQQNTYCIHRGSELQASSFTLRPELEVESIPISSGVRPTFQELPDAPAEGEILHSSPIAQPAFSPQLEDRSFLVTISSFGALPPQSAGRQREVQRGVWCRGSTTVGPLFRNAHEVIRQNTQEITQTFPTTPIVGNSYEHCCWASWLPGRAGHRPQRWEESFLSGF